MRQGHRVGAALSPFQPRVCSEFHLLLPSPQCTLLLLAPPSHPTLQHCASVTTPLTGNALSLIPTIVTAAAATAEAFRVRPISIVLAIGLVLGPGTHATNSHDPSVRD